MMMIDQNGTIVMVNTEIEHLFGYTREELIGQPIEILVPDRLRVRHLGHRRRATPRHEVHR
jgi:protein-histidine pros-kinase